METKDRKVIIEEKVRNDVFELFGLGRFKEGCRILQALSFGLRHDDETELKRLVLRNLSFAYYKIDDMHMARKYAKMIKKIVDEDMEFQNKNKKSYGDVLNLYSEFLPDEVSLEDKIRINKINRSIYCNDAVYMYRYYMAESNICILAKDYEGIEDVIWQIHNRINSNIFEDEKKDKMMKANLEDTKVIILQDLKSVSPIIYKKVMEKMETLKQSNSTIVI